ncbi:OmpP1/FadL family transporter [Acinetobacter terrestris]|uniref:Outer membrane protein transport protein n=1 Tax=Acinetobacter terrestris TaxID=2529843 RepID=A0AAW6UXK1_9GAMM|nr:outer membrane protein transport protein [Acinetobacter terrestris]MDK1685048.1 outer membrane protein transport protein [Acinetobacter terrestris]
MHYTAIKTAVTLSLLAASNVTFAAAMDRSGQSIAPFLQHGNYAEIAYTQIDPTVSGHYRDGSLISDMASTYDFFTGAVKLQATEQYSFGLLWDHPFGGLAEYKGNNPLVEDGTTANFKANTKVDVQSNNLSILIGYRPTPSLSIYGGPVYQRVEGDVQFAGPGFNFLSGYKNKIESTDGYGWLAGFAYEIPEIALKASLTYRSEIDHKAETYEEFQVAGKYAALTPTEKATTAAGLILGGLTQLVGNPINSEFTITTPKSVNLDFQTGIYTDTIAFANVRWVNWKDFTLRPYAFNLASTFIGQAATKGAYQDGFDLTDYAKDQWSANVGVGHKLNEQWGGSVAVGYDSGAGNPISTLGPTDGYWSLGLGLRYNPTEKYEISVGGKYLWLGDAKVQRGDYAIPGNAANAYVGEFEDNHAWAWGAKLGYRF